MDKERFVLQPSREEGWWVCTDQVNLIVCKFRQGKFAKEQHVTRLEGEDVVTLDEAKEYVMHLFEMEKWMMENHPDIASGTKEDSEE